MRSLSFVPGSQTAARPNNDCARVGTFVATDFSPSPLRLMPCLHLLRSFASLAQTLPLPSPIALLHVPSDTHAIRAGAVGRIIVDRRSGRSCLTEERLLVPEERNLLARSTPFLFALSFLLSHLKPRSSSARSIPSASLSGGTVRPSGRSPFVSRRSPSRAFQLVRTLGRSSSFLPR